jgi:hypothetical protein
MQYRAETPCIAQFPLNLEEEEDYYIITLINNVSQASLKLALEEEFIQLAQKIVGADAMGEPKWYRMFGG